MRMKIVNQSKLSHTRIIKTKTAFKQRAKGVMREETLVDGEGTIAILDQVCIRRIIGANFIVQGGIESHHKITVELNFKSSPSLSRVGNFELCKLKIVFAMCDCWIVCGIFHEE